MNIINNLRNRGMSDISSESRRGTSSRRTTTKNIFISTKSSRAFSSAMLGTSSGDSTTPSRGGSRITLRADTGQGARTRIAVSGSRTTDTVIGLPPLIQPLPESTAPVIIISGSSFPVPIVSGSSTGSIENGDTFFGSPGSLSFSPDTPREVSFGIHLLEEEKPKFIAILADELNENGIPSKTILIWNHVISQRVRVREYIILRKNIFTDLNYSVIGRLDSRDFTISSKLKDIIKTLNLQSNNVISFIDNNIRANSVYSYKIDVELELLEDTALSSIDGLIPGGSGIILGI